MSNTTIKVSVKNGKQPLMRDIYFYLMTQSWSKIFLIIFLVFVLINVVFGTIYFNLPMALNMRGPNWWDCFFFSVQTLATIGYGMISPVSFYANILVSIEAGIGIIYTALVTGIVFSKFSRPMSKILFSKPILINMHNGRKVLTFRVGNTRGNDIVDASITVSALIEETSPEGTTLRRIQDLKLERSHSPFFSLSWVIFHTLDESSPLYKLIHNNSLDPKIISVVSLLIGHDGNYSQTVYSRQAYYPEDFVFDRHFKDVLKNLPDRTIEIDFRDFHELK